MRKLYVSLLVAFAALLCLPASAKIGFGIKGGADITNMKFNQHVVDKDNRSGFYLGPTVKLSVLGLGFDASVLYDQRSAKVTQDNGDDVGSDDATLTQKQIAIPVNVRYTIGLGSLANVFLFAGPQVGFNVGGDKKISSIYNWEWKDSNFSVNVGFGVTLLQHLQLNANYNIACGKTGDATLSKIISEVSSEAFHARYNAWQVGLVYYF